MGGVSPSPFRFTLSGLTRRALNYAAPYPIAERIWDCFSENVVRSVDIGID